MYPEHEKLLTIPKGELEVIKRFLEWLNSQDVVLAEWVNYGLDETELCEIYKSHTRIMDGFFGINSQRLAEEKDQMLKDIYTGLSVK